MWWRRIALACSVSGLALFAPKSSFGPSEALADGAREVLVAPSSFHGVHGLAVDRQGRLLAGMVVVGAIWEVDRTSGAARVHIPPPAGEADDIAVGPRDELAWTSYNQGILRYRESDGAPIRELARGLPGINSLAFDQKSGKLYASQVFMADALWEIDVQGLAPPRPIAKDMGGFNGFEVGPDGQLYGPLWFRGSVVRIDPQSGAITTLAEGFVTPAAVNLDGKGNLWALDTATGEVCKVPVTGGQKTVVARLAPSLDNLAIAPDGTLYVSNMADNAVMAIDPNTGSVRTLTRGALAMPSAMKLVDGKLHVADLFAYRAVDPRSGEVQDLARMHAARSTLDYPTGVGVGKELLTLTSWVGNSVQLLDRKSGVLRETLEELRAPVDAIPLDDGTLLILELASGSLLRASGEHYADREVVVGGLTGPTQMILARDGSVLLTEASGVLARIDLGSGTRTVVAEGLAMPEGLAETARGSVLVAESAARKLTEIDLTTGARATVADELPIGLVGARSGLPPAYFPTGVAVDQEGTVYVTGDLDNSLLRLRLPPR